jgi:hypothetical protein
MLLKRVLSTGWVGEGFPAAAYLWDMLQARHQHQQWLSFCTLLLLLLLLQFNSCLPHQLVCPGKHTEGFLRTGPSQLQHLLLLLLLFDGKKTGSGACCCPWCV